MHDITWGSGVLRIGGKKEECKRSASTGGGVEGGSGRCGLFEGVATVYGDFLTGDEVGGVAG